MKRQLLIIAIFINLTAYTAINCRNDDGTLKPLPDLPKSSYTPKTVTAKNIPYKQGAQFDGILGLNKQTFTPTFDYKEGCEFFEKKWVILADVQIETIEHWYKNTFPLTGGGNTYMVSREKKYTDLTIKHEEKHATLAKNFVEAQQAIFDNIYLERYDTSKKAYDAMTIHLFNFGKAKKTYNAMQDHSAANDGKTFKGLRSKILSPTLKSVKTNVSPMTGVLNEDVH